MTDDNQKALDAVTDMTGWAVAGIAVVCTEDNKVKFLAKLEEWKETIHKALKQPEYEEVGIIKELVEMLEYYAEIHLETLYNNRPDFVAEIRKIVKVKDD